MKRVTTSILLLAMATAAQPQTTISEDNGAQPACAEPAETVCSVTLAGDFFETSLANFDGGPAEAFEVWSAMADSGDAGAQYLLGRMHASGEGVEQDRIEAARLFGLAAEQGYARA